MREISTKQQFKDAIIQHKLHDTDKHVLTVVDFHALWCGPCKMIAPALESMSKTYKNVLFIKVDVDQNADIASEYSISAMPTMMVFRKGIVEGKVVGADVGKVEAIIKKALSSAGSSGSGGGAASGKGYVLGSGKQVKSSVSGQTPGVSMDTNQMILLALVAFLAYQYYQMNYSK